MVYKTSSDGLVWTAAITIRGGGVPSSEWGSLFSIWFDGIYLHYTYCMRLLNAPLYYRRGIPNSDGTITWSAAEQTAVAGGATYVYIDPFVSVNSDGYAWIGYMRYDSGIYHPYVTMSGNNDGTWGATPAGFPYQFPQHADNRQNRISPIPLTDSKMLAVYAYNGLTEKAKARLWDGAAWGSEVLTSPKIEPSYHFSAVAEGDDVHLVFMNRSHYDLTYVKYVYSTNSFTAGETLLPGGPYNTTAVISRASNNDLYIFWTGNPALNTLYYIIYTAENDTWGPIVKWESEEEEELTFNTYLTCFYNMYSGFIGLAYMTKKSSPYNVKFKYIAPPPPPGSTPAPGEPGSPGAPEPTPEPKVDSNTMTTSGSRHTTPKQGSVGKSHSFNNTRVRRHITWVPVVIVKA